MAAGKVCTGFSHPYVAKYNCSGGAVTFTAGMRLARGVSISVSPDVSDDNNFYADNGIAETENGKFNGGTATLTVDGLHLAAERFIYGLPEPEPVSYGESKSANFAKCGDDAEPPYVAVGFVTRYQSAGVETFVPTILVKTKFKTHGTDAQTQEEQKDWQTQDLETTLCRDDSPKHNWKWLGDDLPSCEEARAVLCGVLNVADDSDDEETEAS